MSLRLYHNDASPFVRKVMVVLHETGQLADVELVHAKGSALSPGSLPTTRNPLGKIPALDRPEGATLYDSRVICRYLDARAGARLYPAPGHSGEWEVLTLEATADGVMDAAVLMVYETRLRPADKVIPEILEAQWRKIERSLDALETRWMSHLSGPLNIAHVAMGCALDYLDFRHGTRDWRAGHPELAAWHVGFTARESMVATMPRQL